MITGDHLLIALNTALQLGMGDRIFTAERLPMLDPETKTMPKDQVKRIAISASRLMDLRKYFPDTKT
jgi:magnesium-transporting ATPase (P-type)